MSDVNNILNYLKNNKIMVASAIPTQGTFKVGDIIVNNGENNAEEPMWVCTEAGSPGTWEVVGSGGGLLDHDGTGSEGTSTQPLYLEDGVLKPCKMLSTVDISFPALPYITEAGVMEIGKYIDFHDPNGDLTNDHDLRLTMQDGNLHSTGDFINKNSVSLQGLNDAIYTINQNHQTYRLTDGHGFCQNVSSTDCNYIKRTGYFMGSGMTNTPDNSTDWFFIECIAHNDTWCQQIATAFATTQKRYIRHQTNGSWTAWRSL